LERGPKYTLYTLRAIKTAKSRNSSPMETFCGVLEIKVDILRQAVWEEYEEVVVISQEPMAGKVHLSTEAAAISLATARVWRHTRLTGRGIAR
jgi:hypothetical protein